VCDAVELVPPARLQSAREVFAELTRKSKGQAREAVQLTAQEAQDLFTRLKGAVAALAEPPAGQDQERPSGGVFECAICLEDLEEEKVRILRGCKHILCSTCLEQIASIRHGVCV
jgi:hypothetical protein